MWERLGNCKHFCWKLLSLYDGAVVRAFSIRGELDLISFMGEIVWIKMCFLLSTRLLSIVKKGTSRTPLSYSYVLSVYSMTSSLWAVVCIDFTHTWIAWIYFT